MHDGIAVYAIDLRQDAPFELLFVGDANVAQHRADELGEEAFDEIEPGAVFGQEGEREASLRLLSQPGPGFLGLVGGVIVDQQLDRSRGRVGGVDLFEKIDELARAMPSSTRA
jgi:hypothetical protein